MDKLFEIQSVIIKSFSEKKYHHRAVFDKIKLENHATGIIGQRGIGKTTFLIQQALAHDAATQQSLYASADNLYFLNNSLIELVDTLYKETTIRLLCLDEIHKYPDWQQELKNIADTYGDFKILFSGSSMTDLVKSRYDLARRVTLHHLPGLSFREYLAFYHQIDIPVVTLNHILDQPTAWQDTLSFNHVLMHFRAYCQTGYYPFFNRFSGDFEKHQAVVSATQTTIFEDIALHHALKTPSLLVIEQLYKYILQSNPGEMNTNKLAKALNKDHDSIKSYLLYLQQAGLTNCLYTQQTGKAMLRNPKKIYPENTNMMYAHHCQMNDDAQGKLRESFVLNQLKNAGYDVYYTQQGDFAVNDYTLEIGGKNKSTSQLKGQNKAFVVADGIVAATTKRIPLFFLGFLY